MALVGWAQMAADMTTLLQRILPRFMMCTECRKTYCTDPIGCTELYCSDALGSDAVEWLWSAALKWLRTCLGCCNGCYQNYIIFTWPHALHTLRLVLPRLHTRQQSLSVTFSIKTHNRCISILSNTQAKSYRADAQILSGARSFAAQMHWDRTQSNGFGRLHSNGRGHDRAIATNVTKIR